MTEQQLQQLIGQLVIQAEILRLQLQAALAEVERLTAQEPKASKAK